VADVLKIAIERRKKLAHQLKEVEDFLRLAYRLNRMNFDTEEDRGSSEDSAKSHAPSPGPASHAPVPNSPDETATDRHSGNGEPRAPERRLAFRSAFDVAGEGRKKGAP
jgi:hypothetical protein